MIRPLLLSAFFLTSVFSSYSSAEVVLNRGNDTDPSSLDMHKVSTVSENRLLNDLYEGLIVYGADGSLLPGVAKSWEISPDGKIYRFQLREDAKWSNGDPVTAADFVFALRRELDPKTASPYTNVIYPIENAEAVATGKLPGDKLGVEAEADGTLQIRLNAPTPYFLSLLTHYTTWPLHRASYEKYGDKFTQNGHLISNGPFMLESFAPNDKIAMRKNPYFHDADNVKIDQVNWFPFEDRSSCMRRFEANEIQICSDVAAEQMDYIKANLGNAFHMAPQLGSYYLSVKGKDGSPLQDVRVRRAISMAIDRDFIANQVWRGTMLPSDSLVPPGIANYVSGGVKDDYADKDILDREDEAKQLLKEAGVAPDSLNIELFYNTSENNKNTLAAISDMLRNIGISSRLEEREGTSYFNYLHDGGAFDLARNGWYADINDPYSFLFLNRSDNPFNYSKWANKQYDTLLDEAAATGDVDKRAGFMAKAETILLRDQAVIPLMTYTRRSLVSDRVQGWQGNLTSSEATRWLSLKP